MLRPAEPADAGAIAAIHLTARRDATPWLPVLHDAADVRDWMASAVLPHATVWIAEVAGRPQGFMVLAGDMLEQLYVAPEHQGRGLGSRLLDKAKALAPGGLRLYVFQRNRAARAFYEARGFVAVAFTDGADNEEREPDVLYAWSPSRAPASSA